MNRKVFCAGVLLFALCLPAEAQQAKDKLIVPGYRIAGLRLAGRLADIGDMFPLSSPAGAPHGRNKAVRAA